MSDSGATDPKPVKIPVIYHPSDVVSEHVLPDGRGFLTVLRGGALTRRERHASLARQLGELLRNMWDLSEAVEDYRGGW